MKKQRSMRSTLKSMRLEKLVMQRLSTPNGCSELSLDQRSYQSNLAQLEMLNQNSSRSSCCRWDYISSGSTDYSNGTSVETSGRHGNIFQQNQKFRMDLDSRTPYLGEDEKWWKLIEPTAQQMKELYKEIGRPNQKDDIGEEGFVQCLLWDSGTQKTSHIHP